MGTSTSVVVSNAAVGREVLKTDDLNFAFRPEFGASEYEIYKDCSFFIEPYTKCWCFIKKICMTQLLSAPLINGFADVRMEEMGKVLELLVKCSKEGEACNLSTELMTMSSSITGRMSMSTRCSESYNGSKKIRELPNEIRDQSQHREEREGDNGDRRRKDVMEILMEIHEDDIAEVKISRNNIKAFLLWTLAEIINHPHVFNKLREEITVVVGLSRLVRESDILNLPYLQAIMNGSLLLHPNLPFIPRKCKDDCKIQGYDMLANSRTVINNYAIVRDPDSWENPLDFIPDRFLENLIQRHRFSNMRHLGVEEEHALVQDSPKE
ncbi:hypothetical protein RJ639_025184 [Escallonia herrerae]|uniref:Cytochrome P450 n=1 Tax=Escallonia herrerae TaxID=1293975 RepID=A0AA89ACV4_9ASTE|nr:hypothetical protein RJ639_025184 [Escallonia herrerae]